MALDWYPVTAEFCKIVTDDEIIITRWHGAWVSRAIRKPLFIEDFREALKRLEKSPTAEVSDE